MTQPRQQPSWINELINRYKGFKDEERYRTPEPVGFDFERPPFDPSNFYRQFGTLRGISKAGTRVEQQREANRRLQQQQQEQAPIDLSNQQQGPRSGIKNGLGLPLGNLNITSGYGHRTHPVTGQRNRMHTGLDLSAPSGTPIYATHDGYINLSGWNGGYGNTVIVGGSNGLQTLYAHQSKLAVKKGDYVRKGQVIGYVGSTGMSTGPHLHYEVIINGQKVNPRSYI